MLSLLFIDGFNCLKAAESLRGDSLLYIIQFPGVPGTLLIDLGRMSWSWSHPMVLNLGPLDWESSTLNTRPLLNSYCSITIDHCSISRFEVRFLLKRLVLFCISHAQKSKKVQKYSSYKFRIQISEYKVWVTSSIVRTFSTWAACTWVFLM